MKKIKIYFAIFLVFFTFFFGLLNAQTHLKILSDSIHNYSLRHPWEKIYLHTDKPQYFVNDTIWIKAYAVMESGKEEWENSKSVPLYVELIKAGKTSSEEQVIISLFEGKGFADIVIPRNTEPGFYTLRAYTNWMRNYGEESFFHKDIWIGDIKEMNLNLLSSNNPSRIDFFPEGGDLISGINSKIAFKAVNGLGKGEDVFGYILNSTMDTLFQFESEFLGMGSFYLTPGKGERYTALVKMPDNDWKSVSLPNIKDSGIVMTAIHNEGEQLEIKIKHNLPKDIEVHLFGISQGRTVWTQSLETRDHEGKFLLSKDDFDPGIVKFTLFDNSFTPMSERLVYFHQFAFGQVSFHSEKNSYKPKEVVKMEIEIVDEFGIPVSGDFSLAITDGFQVPKNPFASNIYSHFLLGNELKGEVEMPAYYFEPSNKNAVFHLDNLLLTQGWRRFSWESLAKSNETPKFKMENGLNISGNVKTLGSKQVKEPQQITMIINSFYDLPLVIEGVTDAFGDFSFDGLNFTDSVWVFAQAFLERERRSGEVRQLKYNEIELVPAKRPEVTDRPIISFQKNDEWVAPDDYIVEVGQARRMMEQFILGREIELSEITVMASRKDRLPDKRAILYGDLPEASLEVTTEHYIYTNVFDLIRGRFAGVNVVGNMHSLGSDPPRILVRGGTISGPAGSGGGQLGGAQIWIDGNPASADLAMTIAIANIERIDLLKSLARTAMFGGPTINILTRQGNPNRTFLDEPRADIGNAIMFSKGFAPYREFYVPSLENHPGSPIFRDYRSTIYWNPNIQTGIDGKVWIEFPLTEGKPEIQFTLEGLSDKNYPYSANYSLIVN